MNNIVGMGHTSLSEVGTVPQLTCDGFRAGGTPFGEEFAEALGAIRFVLSAGEPLARQRPGFVFSSFDFVSDLLTWCSWCKWNTLCARDRFCTSPLLLWSPGVGLLWVIAQDWSNFNFHISNSPCCTWYTWWRTCPRSSQRSRCHAPEMKNNQDTGFQVLKLS